MPSTPPARLGPGLRFAAWKNDLSSACADDPVGGSADPHDEPFIGWATGGSVRWWRNGAADARTASEAVFVLSRVTRLKVALGLDMPTARRHSGERLGAVTFLAAFFSRAQAVLTVEIAVLSEREELNR